MSKQTSAEFIIAGYSHSRALGAPGPSAYKGPRGIVSISDKHEGGLAFIEENAELPKTGYWTDILDHVENRYILLSWSGNQHITNFLFEGDIPFDIYDPEAKPPITSDLNIARVPRGLVKARLAPAISPLPTIIKMLQARNCAGISIIAGPPPSNALRERQTAYRQSQYWRATAERCGVNLEESIVISPLLLLKFWRIVQEQLAEAASATGTKHVPVPPSVIDDNGLLLPQYCISSDFTHANEKFGDIMRAQALRTLEA